MLKTFTYFISLLILSIFIKAFVYLNTIDSGIEYIVLFILIASSSDIGGYFGGMFFETNSLQKKWAPMISPNKTWRSICWLFIFFNCFFIIHLYILCNRSEL
ncbi:phosphatidate cytidylyltransferase [Mycoplasmopsis felis]|uniref:phosphatidate cytidylyltransferase n=1 Tax=Mycoplasmopsis felis TaxID=33923 RepID=UPI0021E06674|nr:phosphatidate cytidylyltransferase [Mycoplasmopsis felis]MCU9932128.1 phosphatidate cytidylyltransferase [Mycoplasmopsis felis]